VADILKMNPPTPQTLLTVKELFRWAQVVEPPDVASKRTHNKHDLWRVEFIECLRRFLVEDLSRSLENVRGEGYILAEAETMLPMAEEAILRAQEKMYGKYNFKSRHLDESQLSAEGRQAATESRVRVAWMESVSRQARAKATRSRSHRPPGSPPVYNNIKPEDDGEGGDGLDS
jgi:hypothetical protein